MSIPGNHVPGRSLVFVSKGTRKERLRQYSVIDPQNRIMHWGNSFVSQAIVSKRISKFLYLLHLQTNCLSSQSPPNAWTNHGPSLPLRLSKDLELERGRYECSPPLSPSPPTPTLYGPLQQGAVSPSARLGGDCRTSGLDTDLAVPPPPPIRLHP